MILDTSAAEKAPNIISKLPPELLVVCGQCDGQFELALIAKRTYDISKDGVCSLSEKQERVWDDSFPHEEVEAPLVSPPRCDNDCFAFKQATDLVVQGAAYTYRSGKSKTNVSVSTGNLTRSINVYGDRIAEWKGERIQFSEPKEFERMPVRYDRAFGGQDRTALARHGDEIGEAFESIRPEWQLSTTTPYHYPRNPSGCGYLIEADAESVKTLRVPNLEFNFDPITPDRLAVGDPKAWMNGRLPASFDWCEQAWFPRVAYIGFTPEHDGSVKRPAEIDNGFASDDLLQDRSLYRMEFHPAFFQGASAGLAIKDFASDAVVQIRNMFPERPEMPVQLPGEAPWATLTPKWKEALPLTPHLSSVVIRPDNSQVVMTWSCRTIAERPYAPNETAEMPYTCEWKR